VATFEKREIRGKILRPLPTAWADPGVNRDGTHRAGRGTQAKWFGLKVIAHDPTFPRVFQRLGVEPVPFDRLIQESDFISIHASLTPQSTHMNGIEQSRG